MSVRIHDARCDKYNRCHSHTYDNYGNEVCELDEHIVRAHPHLATARKCSYCGAANVPILRNCPNCGASK